MRQDTGSKLQDSHILYVVTLFRIDGRPAASGELLSKRCRSLKGLILSQKLDRPVLIGHSLGALFDGARAERARPGFRRHQHRRFAGIPRLPQPWLVREGHGRDQLEQEGEQFAAQQLRYMRDIGVIDPVTAEKLAKLSSRI